MGTDADVPGEVLEQQSVKPDLGWVWLLAMFPLGRETEMGREGHGGGCGCVAAAGCHCAAQGPWSCVLLGTGQLVP